jgi:hypothetical protein
MAKKEINMTERDRKKQRNTRKEGTSKGIKEGSKFLSNHKFSRH